MAALLRIRPGRIGRPAARGDPARSGQPPPVPLIGFAGAPFTLACYLVEGGPSREFARTKTLLHAAPDVWAALMDRLTETTIAYTSAQVAAGAQVVQVFDSWVGGLSPLDYRTLGPALDAAHLRRRWPPSASRPSISGRERPASSALQAEAGGDVIGLDWRIALVGRLGARRRPRGPGKPGPDPAARAVGDRPPRRLDGSSPRPAAGRATSSISGTASCPDTDPDDLVRLVDLVHEATVLEAVR